MKKKFFVIGNLKMNMLSSEEALQYVSVLKREAAGRTYQSVTGVICPSYPYLGVFEEMPGWIEKGAQNVFWEKGGAYTGEVSPLMLKNAGVNYVIIGHSERRTFQGETNEIVKKKIICALKYLLVPIVCIGETKEERQADDTLRVLELQLQSIFSELSKMQAEKIIIAYEPRWAVGTDQLPTTEEILQVKILIRKILTENFDAELGERVVVLYGGSVKSSFLPAVSFEAGMDGVLVGRESLFPYEVIKMMDVLEEHALLVAAKKNKEVK